METAMKITLLTLVLLLLTGSGKPQAVTQAAAILQQTSKAKPQRVAASEFTGKVIKVVDGDTIDVLTDDKEKVRIRFSGIDTPERGQPYGNNATRLLKKLIAGKTVRVVPQGGDRYKRTVGAIYHQGRLINLSLVEAGLAWHYVKYAPKRTDLAFGTAGGGLRVLLGGSNPQPSLPPYIYEKI
jgi:endonuclease YncB( thermonuclease family)